MTIVKLETIANSNYSIKQHTNRDKDLFYKFTKLSPAKSNPLIFVTVIKKQFARINSCKTQPKWDSQEWKKVKTYSKKQQQKKKIRKLFNKPYSNIMFYF